MLEVGIFYPHFINKILTSESDTCRVFLDAKQDLHSHFTHLAREDELPSLETILTQANVLVKRYASQDAYEQALSHAESKDAPDHMKVPFGSSITTTSSSEMATDASQSDMLVALPAEDVPKVHQEADKFDDDRVLANSILFLQDFGWWTEMSYAVPEGDIGRVFEILKVSPGSNCNF